MEISNKHTKRSISQPPPMHRQITLRFPVLHLQPPSMLTYYTTYYLSKPNILSISFHFRFSYYGFDERGFFGEDVCGEMEFDLFEVVAGVWVGVDLGYYVLAQLVKGIRWLDFWRLSSATVVITTQLSSSQLTLLSDRLIS